MSFRNVSRRLRKNRSANLSNCFLDLKGAIDIGITGLQGLTYGAEDEDPEYYINEAQTLLICMLADTDKAKVVRGEIIEIVNAWWRGKLAPRSAAPRLLSILEMYK